MSLLLGMFEGIALLAQDSDAREAGRLCGSIVWPLLMLAGVLKCVQIAKRPTTSALCAWSLAFALMAWGFPVVGNYIAESTEDPTMTRVWQLLSGVGSLILVMVAVILAILGLAMYRADFVQGRKQAIWSLVLSGVVLLLIGLGVVSAIASQWGSNAVADQPAIGEPIVFDELNFETRLPNSRWTQIKASTLSPDAALVLRRTRPEIIWIVIAETYSSSLELDNEALLQFAESNGRSASDECVFSEGTPTTLDGLPALHATSRATIDGQAFSYDYRLLVHNGYAYQLITMCGRANQKHLRAAADELASNFRLIDPTRQGVSGDEVSAEPVDSLSLPEAGLTIDLSDVGWTTWEDMKVAYPQASVGAVLDQQCTLGVLALPLDGIEATDRELFETLLDPVGYSLYDASLRSRESVTLGPAKGYRFTAEYETDIGPMEARLYAVRTEHWAYLINGWAPKDQSHLIDRLDGVIRGTRIDDTAAPHPLPDRAAEHAAIYNALGLSAYHGGDFHRALIGFTKAYELQPDYETYADNRIDAYEELGQYDRGIAFANQHLQEYPNHHEARANLAYQITYGDAKAEAIDHYRLSFEAGFQSDYYLVDYVRTLRGEGRYDEALELIDRYALNQSDTDLTIERCRTLADLERHPEAIAILEARAAEALASPMLLAEWIRAQLRTGATREAVELGQTLTDEHPDQAEVWYARGLAESELEWYPQARSSLQRAVDLSNLSHYRDQLDYVAGLLGRGDNTLARTPIEPVALPGSLAEEAPPHPASDDHHAHLHHHSIALYFRPNEPFRTTIRKRVTITGADALETWSTIHADFDSQYERVYVNDLTVYDAEGRVVARGDLDTYFIIDDQQDGINSDDKTLSIPVPGLTVGHSLDYTISYETLGDASDFEFRQYHFASRHPVARMIVFVDADTDDVAVTARGGISSTDAASGRVWVMDALPIYRWEPLMPDLDTLFPMVTLGPVDHQWEELGREYLDDLADVLQPPADFKDEAGQILRGAESTRQVIERATRHVQDSLTYEAIEFGVRGIIPHTLEQITAQRFGDCKDHSLLLYHLLREGGVRAYLATVQTAGPLVEDIPTLEQFDHMVVFVPDTDGGLVLDATDKSHPALRGTPYGIQNRTLLVLDPERPRLVHPTPTEGNRYLTRRKIQVDPSGDLLVREVLSATGPWSEGLLEVLKGATPEEQLSYLQNSLDAEDGLRLTHVETSDLNDLNGPLTIKIAYTIPAAFERQGQGWYGRLPAPWELYYLTPSFLPQRQYDFERTVDFEFVSSTEIEFPDGTRLAQVPPITRIEEASVKASIESELSGNQLILRSRITLPRGRFPASRYSVYQNELQAALRALRPRLHLQPSPSSG